MGNESGTWIMYGVDWDDPECLRTVEDTIDYINEIGFLPLFKNEIPGFSLEERTVPAHWWCEDPEKDPWMWRAIIARKHDIIYGKFFDKKAGSYQKSGCLCSQTTEGTAMILMPYMKMERHHINIK